MYVCSTDKNSFKENVYLCIEFILKFSVALSEIPKVCPIDFKYKIN